MKITAKNLIDLLAVRHSGDIFVPECKNGPTQGASNLLKLDAWAMKRSWTNPITYGYEIKVSRSDFLSDNKWTGYLKYCSHFSFVAPTGVIKPDELPKRVGLIVPTKNGNKLLTKKKAPPRNVKIPEDLFRYVLMCRATIGSDISEGNLEFWKSWLEDKEVSTELGRRVSKSLRKTIAEKITNVEIENMRLKSQNESLATISKFCDKLGIIPSRYISESRVKQKVSEANSSIPVNVKRMVERIATSASQLQQLVEAE